MGIKAGRGLWGGGFIERGFGRVAGVAIGGGFAGGRFVERGFGRVVEPGGGCADEGSFGCVVVVEARCVLDVEDSLALAASIWAS